jgi:Zn-dependent protease
LCPYHNSHLVDISSISPGGSILGMRPVPTNSRSFPTQTACSTHGLYYNMDFSLFQSIIFFTGLIIAITIHEFSHAFVADYFGDPTPRSYGRVSLNPLRHLDPLGTLMLFVVHFGWGKPVPIDPYNLSKREELLVALAGPASNLVLATILAIILKFFPLSIIYVFIQTNVFLAVFNLFPIPPLDGSKIFLNLLPEAQSVNWQQAFDQYGTILLLVLIFLPINGSNIISLVMMPIVSFLLKLLVFI